MAVLGLLSDPRPPFAQYLSTELQLETSWMPINIFWYLLPLLFPEYEPSYLRGIALDGREAIYLFNLPFNIYEPYEPKPNPQALTLLYPTLNIYIYPTQLPYVILQTSYTYVNANHITPHYLRTHWPNS